MDYEQLSTPELQQECKRRGLPSGRAKADLVQRLTEDDTKRAPAAEDVTAAPEPDVPADDEENEPAPEPASEPPAEPVVSPTTVRCTFPAGNEGPGEEEHLAYRQTTIQTAADKGLTPLGDAYRVGTVDGLEVYEVHVQAVT